MQWVISSPNACEFLEAIERRERAPQVAESLPRYGSVASQPSGLNFSDETQVSSSFFSPASPQSSMTVTALCRHRPAP
jgi:hypothetical protein